LASNGRDRLTAVDFIRIEKGGHIPGVASVQAVFRVVTRLRLDKLVEILLSIPRGSMTDVYHGDSRTFYAVPFKEVPADAEILGGFLSRH